MPESTSKSGEGYTNFATFCMLIKLIINHLYGCRILELSNRLFLLCLRANAEEKVKILRLIASDYV
jgi:hypothetical protein